MNLNRSQQHRIILQETTIGVLHDPAALWRPISRLQYRVYQLLVCVFLLCGVALPVQAGNLIQVPIRWCVIGNDANGNGHWDPGEVGTPAFTNPGGVLNGQGMPEPDTDNVLWRRHERASDNIWIP